MVLIVVKIAVLIFFLMGIGVFIPIIFGFLFKRKINTVVINSFLHSQDQLWTTIKEIKNYPSWRSDITKLDMEHNLENWREYFNDKDYLNYTLTEKIDKKLLTLSLTHSNLPVSFTRKYTIWTQDYMSFLKVEDQLIIRKSYLRFFSSLAYDNQQVIKSLMVELDQFLDKKYGAVA